MADQTPIEKAAEAADSMAEAVTGNSIVFTPNEALIVARAALTAALGSVEETARVLCFSAGRDVYNDHAPCDEHQHAAEALHAWLLREPETKEAGRG